VLALRLLVRLLEEEGQALVAEVALDEKPQPLQVIFKLIFILIWLDLVSLLLALLATSLAGVPPVP
jgi:hypothetical protein